MAHNTRTRANLAAWGLGTTVSDTEFDALDQNGFTAINGDDGGVWAPSAAIEIGGSGVKLTGGNHIVDGSSSILGFENQATLNMGDGTNASGMVVKNASSATFLSGSSLTALSGSTVTVASGATMTIGCDPTLSGAMIVQSGGEIQFNAGSILDIKTANTTFSDNAYFTGAGTTLSMGASTELDFATGATLDSRGTADFTGTTTLSGTVGLTVPMTCSSTGRVRLRYTAGVDADHTYGIDDGDVIYVTITAPRLYGLNTTNAAAGDTITFVNYSGTQTLTTFGGRSIVRDGTHAFAITYIYNGSTWLILHSSVVFT